MNYKQEIVNSIQKISGKYSPYQIFRDWCEMLAIAIQNSCCLFHDDLWKQREDLYTSIFSKYEDSEKEKIFSMTAILPLAYEENMTDLLGEIYMESGCGNSSTGQFFTPFHLSEMVARVNQDEYLKKKVEMFEPSVGGGGMVIAVAKVMKDSGINYQRNLKVVAQDIDWLSVYMSYIQFSLLGINAIVIQGDSLSQPFIPGNYEKRRILKTPKAMGALM